MLRPVLQRDIDDAAVDVLHDVLLDHPPQAYRFSAPISLVWETFPLGGYLLTLGYITPRQLGSALRMQDQLHKNGVMMPLGEIMVMHQMLMPRVLAGVLIVQLADRLHLGPSTTQRLGERLVASGALTPRALATALEAQIRLRHSGIQWRLGEVLIRCRLLDRPTVQAHLTAPELESRSISPPFPGMGQ